MPQSILYHFEVQKLEFGIGNVYKKKELNYGRIFLWHACATLNDLK